MKTYINYNSGRGKETVDEFNRADFATMREFMAYVRAMVAEYNMAFGGGCYRSRRACNNWRD